MSHYINLSKGETLTWQDWNLKEELAKVNYKIKKEPVHLHSCPYCGYLNRQRRYKNKGPYTKCENCERIFKNCSRKNGYCG